MEDDPRRAPTAEAVAALNEASRQLRVRSAEICDRAIAILRKAEQVLSRASAQRWARRDTKTEDQRLKIED